MVNQAATKKVTWDGAHGEKPNEKKASQRNKDFKKKGSRNNTTNNRMYEGVPELLRDVGFTLMGDGPDLYLKQ